MAGLDPRRKGSRPRIADARVQAKIARKTQQTPDDGSTHWSCRKMAQALGLSKSTVQRVWARTRLKPHRLDRYMASNDPHFEETAADIIGLYLNPPQHAAVFCLDEKTAIRSLERLDPVLPLSPGRAERHVFEYYRHGTLSLYAALDVKTATRARHDRRAAYSATVHRLSGGFGAASWMGQGDLCGAHNLSAHKTYSSWLNQVELWFAKIQRDVISRGVFTSVADLGKKIRKYIRAYAKSAKPFRWAYTDPPRRTVLTKSSGQLTSNA
jgi:hypothetical protein